MNNSTPSVFSAHRCLLCVGAMRKYNTCALILQMAVQNFSNYKSLHSDGLASVLEGRFRAHVIKRGEWTAGKAPWSGHHHRRGHGVQLDISVGCMLLPSDPLYIVLTSYCDTMNVERLCATSRHAAFQHVSSTSGSQRHRHVCAALDTRPAKVQKDIKMIPLPAPPGYVSAPGYGQGPPQRNAAPPEPREQQLQRVQQIQQQATLEKQKQQRQQQQRAAELQRQNDRQRRQQQQQAVQRASYTAPAPTSSTGRGAVVDASPGPVQTTAGTWTPAQTAGGQATARTRAAAQQRLSQMPQSRRSSAVGAGTAAVAQPQAEYVATTAATIMSQRPEGAIVVDADFSESGALPAFRLFGAFVVEFKMLVRFSIAYIYKISAKKLCCQESSWSISEGFSYALHVASTDGPLFTAENVAD